MLNYYFWRDAVITMLQETLRAVSDTSLIKIVWQFLIKTNYDLLWSSWSKRGLISEFLLVHLRYNGCQFCGNRLSSFLSRVLHTGRLLKNNTFYSSIRIFPLKSQINMLYDHQPMKTGKVIVKQKEVCHLLLKNKK